MYSMILGCGKIIKILDFPKYFSTSNNVLDVL